MKILIYLINMKILKPYSNIKNFLYRFSIIKIGILHIRIHKIVDKDRTSFYHNHPFHYLSIILKGGYEEHRLVNNEVIIKRFSFLSFIFRNRNSYHRINSIIGETITLFIAYGNYSWDIIQMNENNSDDGLYYREINNTFVWTKKENGIFYIGNKNKDIALKETRYSIHQI